MAGNAGDTGAGRWSDCAYRRYCRTGSNPTARRTWSAGDQAGGVDGSSSIDASSSRAEEELEGCMRAAGHDWLRWCREGGRGQLPPSEALVPPLTEACDRSTVQLSHTSSSASIAGRAWARNMAGRGR